MATSTPNLNLILPDYSDKADISVLNDNFQKIDEYCANGGVSNEDLQNALNAANAWANATASAESVSADNEADVKLTKGDDSKNLHFSIPRGQPGVLISETEPTDPNVKVWIKPDGEPNELEQLKGDVSSLKDHTAEHGELLYSIGLGERVVLSTDDFFPGFWSTSLQTGGAFANLRTHQEMLPNNGPVVVHVESEDLSNICVTATGYKADGSYNGYPVQNAPISNGKYTLSLSGTYPYYRIAIAKFVDNAYVALPSDVKITVGEKGDEAVLKLLDKQKYRLFDSVQKPITFEGHMLAYGDSITAGVTSPNLAVTENSYIKLLANHVGMTLGNRAISGTCITDTDDAPNSIYKRVTSWTYDADVVVVAGGTNDYALGMPLGEFGSTDITTFYGALKGICEHFKANYADSTVIFITPIPQTVEQAAAILPLDAYRSAIFEVATSYGYNVVDGNSLGMPEKADAWGVTMVADACHPTEAGHALYFRGLCGKLL